MGYSYSQLNGPVMCFNNAKNWQLGWFGNAKAEVGLNEAYNGNIKGQVNYNPLTSGQAPVVIKINNPNSADDYYVGYNLKTSHNSGSAEGGNQVTIQIQGGEGSSTASSGPRSTLLAKLSAGGTWSINDPSGRPISVTFNSASNEEADVSITYGTVVPTTPAPTSSPTHQVSLYVPFFDRFEGSFRI